MKVYIIALIDGKYMFPVYDKVFKSKRAAVKKCEELSKDIKGTYHVLMANNWHKEEDND